jgi:hypothetical protein
MKDENSVPTAQKMTDVSLSIFRSKFKKADSDDRLHELASNARLICKPEVISSPKSG